MALPTPFHPRTAALCTSYRWKDWAGYHAVCTYDYTHDKEYFAFRHAAGLLDVTPLFKYEVRGAGAAEFLAYITARDVRKLKVGRVAYSTWCDGNGHVLDDGTIVRLDDERFRLTSAEPAFAWMLRFADRFDVRITDITDQIAAVSLQGPTSRDVLNAATGGAVEGLRFFGHTKAAIGGHNVDITRTGYTGDLGYEIWVDNEGALPLWDTLMAEGKAYGIEPCGLDALDMTRVEAGFVLMGVDYTSARYALIADQKSTPDELGLGWTVHLDREPFLGQAAIRRERASKPEWDFVGLEIDWEEIEQLYDKWGLPPHFPAAAWREVVPLYDSRGVQVGRATSGSWSPTLKKNLALATVQARASKPGTRLKIELMVEYERKLVTATVVKKPFFDPERKRS